MGYEILIKSRSQKISTRHIVEVAIKHLKLRKAEEGTLEVELISKAKIQKINKKFRKINSPTDVLSFPVAEVPAPKQKPKTKLYGTIFLSCDIIKLNAEESDKLFIREFDFILAHGIDHLLGIHHK
ncbi:MAG: rRNA maturation RNase YbeY [bacterium]